MKTKLNVCSTSALVLLLFMIATPADAGRRFISFDFPGAIDTEAASITPTGDIVGRYTSADGMVHGFLRSKGKFTSIDVPGAALTVAAWINADGLIVGGYNKQDGVLHGFLLEAGQFTAIDYPGAQLTVAYGIGPTGDIVGVETDSGGALHGFLFRNGRFRQIDYPGATATLPTMIIGDRIVGGYFDDAGAHGFLLRKGNFKGIDCPGYTNLFLSGLNSIGEMTGGFNSPDGSQHGALVSSDNTCRQLDFPGSSSTYTNAAVAHGDIVGRYADADNIVHAYLLKR